MKFDHLAILLTCHSLEDFPVHHEGEDADSLLANWTALWHPQLIADAEKLPTWIRTYEVPENCQGHLFLCPTTSDSELQTGFAQRVKEENGKLIRRKTDRDSILAAIFADNSPAIDSNWVQDFFALGYCFLQIQLLTRQLRYSSNLDEVYFASLVVDAAKAISPGSQTSRSNSDQDEEGSKPVNNEKFARDKIQAAFDLLMEERDNFYPVNALLVDLTLLAESTLGSGLEAQLKEQSIHCNYLATGEIVEKLSANQELCNDFKAALNSKSISLVGGTYSESRIPLLGIESIVDDFRAGQEIYKREIDAEASFFGRRRFGLGTSLPQILEHFQFRGAFHFTLDDGRFPEGMQIKSFWEGDGEARIEVFGRIPLDANSPGNFLNLGVKIGESFDMDHAAAICFVHWPGKNSVWYDDLKRISRFGSVLGRFVSATEFLEEMEEPYQHDHFTADQYQSPYLKQAVIRNTPNPISSSIHYQKSCLHFDFVKSIQFLTDLFSKSDDATPLDLSLAEITQAFERGDREEKDLEEKMQQKEKVFAERFVQTISTHNHSDEPSSTIKPGSKSRFEVVLNPTSLIERMAVAVDSETTPSVEKPVYAVAEKSVDDKRSIVIDVPAMGYATIQNGDNYKPAKKPQLIVQDDALRNEFLELSIDPSTGGIRSVHDYKSRGNRLSQILAFRGPSDSQSSKFTYSQMELDKLEVLANSTAEGRLRTRGKLLWDGKKIGEFTQIYSLVKGSRVVQVDVEWRSIDPPKGDPWNSYFGSRFAFGDESSNISTTVNQTRHPVANNRFEAPLYIDLETMNSRTSILTGGVPFHVRRGDRYIDSIHVVKGESGRCFRFGIGVDLPNPIFQAQSLLKSPVMVTAASEPSPPYSWLFHFDSRNILATSWEAIPGESPGAGFRVRILETMGRKTSCKLSSFKPITAAKQIRFDGQPVADLGIKEGVVELQLSANQFLEIEARW